MGLSNYLRDLMLERVFVDTGGAPGGLWVSLHSGDPDDSGAAELREYERQRVEFGANGAGSVTNRSALEFGNLPDAIVTHFGVWDAPQRGRYLLGAATELGVIVAKGRSLRWREGELTLRIP